MRGELLAEGKTKIIYADASDPAQAIIFSKDDITAGDGARRDTLPGKGALSGRRTAAGSYLKRNALEEGTRFDPTVLELFFKDDANHDPLVDAAWIAEHEVATPEEVEQLTAIGRDV